MLAELLARIESFRPTDDNWRALDEHVAALGQAGTDLFAALPALFRVFERYPRHDGHGVFWSILHLIESVRGYEAILLDHVQRAPTELGITMLQRIANNGIVRIGITELDPLIVELTPRAPVIDYSIDPQPIDRRAVSALLAALEQFRPTTDPDWTPLLVTVAQLLDTNDVAVVTPLLQTLDRFHAHDGFSPFWPIVNGLEQLAGFASALVASQQHTPTRYGITLLLRLLARDVTIVDGVDIAALAAEQIAREPATS